MSSMTSATASRKSSKPRPFTCKFHAIVIDIMDVRVQRR